MSKDLMREQFEAWAIARGQSVLRQGAGYAAERTGMAWLCWQASREAVVVELPNPADYEVYNDHSDFLHVDDVELMKAVRAAIEAKGVKFK